MLDWRTIDYVHWALKRDALGEVAFGHLDPLQAVRAIALTEKGTCPLHPEKCVRLVRWIDEPEHIAKPNIARELWDAVTTYEPRVVMQDVTFRGVEYGRWAAVMKVVLAGDIDKRIQIVEVPLGAS